MVLLLACVADPPSIPARFAQRYEGGEGLLVPAGRKVPVGEAHLVADPPGCADIERSDERVRWAGSDCRVLAVDPPARGDQDVLLISIDTLRADHVQYAPSLVAFAESAWTFESARSPSPWTYPALVAALTGRQIEVELGPEQTVHPVDDALPAVLGLRARAVVANPHLAPNRGATVGFDHARVVEGDQEVVDQALAWLAEPGGDLILAHVMGPHWPYAGGDGRFGDLAAARRGEVDPDRLPALYRETVTKRLEKLAPLYDAADVVVVFSDHGEELWEHGGFEHGHALWEELLRVPLMIKAPGLPARVDPRPARLVDLAPTLAGLLDVPAPPTWQGVDLAKADPGVDVAGQLLYDSEHRAAWVAGGMKLLDQPGGALLFALPDETTTHADDPTRARLAALVEARPESDLRAGPSTATPSWARAVDLDGVVRVEAEGPLLSDPARPWWNCG